MSVRISYSSELMKNYKQMGIIEPQKKFESLQTSDGHSLFFSIGTDGIFYLVRETVGHSTGWEKMDLSSDLAQYHNGAKVTAKTFAVAQNIRTGNIDIGLAITVEGKDYLYASTNNSNSDTSWGQSTSWNMIPYDDPKHIGITLDITNIYIAQGRLEEFMFVDTLRKPINGTEFLYRYYINPTKSNGSQCWNPHDIGANLHPDVASCIGQRTGDRVEGIYTLGEINGEKELIYMLVYNPFNPNIPPSPVRLVMPPKASAIAVAEADNMATDLYVAADKALYYFPSDKQEDGQAGTKVLESDVFLDVQKLYAHTTETKVIIWGLNRQQEIFYTICEKNLILTQSAWSTPLPILKNVEQVATYVNCVDDGNFFFAHVGGGQLKIGVQSPSTTLWTYKDILLPLPDTETDGSLSFDSYTTRIQVSDEQNRPVANARINIAALDRCSVYINNRYYVLGTEPISIESSVTGGITIIEKTEDLTSSCFKISSDGGEVISINPMDKPQNKIASLDTKDKLGSATIEYDDNKTPPKSLVSNISDEDKEAFVGMIKQLSKVSKSLPADGSRESKTNVLTHSLAAVAYSDVFVLSKTNQGIRSFSGSTAALYLKADGFTVGEELDLSNLIDIVAGDLFSWLKNVYDDISHFIIAAAEGAWHFIVKVGEKAYRFVIDCAAKVAHAFQAVFEWIKTKIEDLINWLKFLFGWKDIIRTRDVFKKLAWLYLNSIIDEAQIFKAEFDDLITDAKKSIDDWADIKADPWRSVNHHNQILSYVISSTSFASVFAAPGMFLLEHFIENLFQIEDRKTIPVPDKSKKLIDDTVMNALEQEVGVFTDAIDRIRTEIFNAVETLPLDEILKKLAAISADAVLNTSQTLVDLLIDVFTKLAKWSIDELFESRISIPIISDILRGFGIDASFSLFDLICLIAAVVATLTYKVARNRAPFSESDGFTSRILAANSMNDLRTSFADTNIGFMSNRAATSGPGKQRSWIIDKMKIELTPVQQEALFSTCRIFAGIVEFLSIPIIVLDCGQAYNKKISFLATVFGICSVGLNFLPNQFASPCPIDNKTWAGIDGGITTLKLVKKVGFWGWGKYKTKGMKGQKEVDIEAEHDVLGAGVDVPLALLSLAPTIRHFYELSKKPESKDRTLAIIDETSSICDCLSKIGIFAAKQVKDPKSKIIIAGVTGAVVGVTGCLHLSEGIVNLAA